ncbi:STAS domain-containing protein [Nonomuraea fuscirosea]|uniref:STAS domain-containing protein n=1 Tax=Nonomuraea fuscirosea TaxID=1291556 RepID=UPI003406B538
MRLSSTRYSVGDRVVTLTPVGEIDLLTAGALRAAIADTLCAPRPVDVVVDLAGVTFLDCAGIGALVAGRNIAIRRGRGYTVVNSQRHVRRLLDLAGVLQELTHLPEPALSTSRPAQSPRPERRGLDQWAELAAPAIVSPRHIRVPSRRRGPMKKWSLTMGLAAGDVTSAGSARKLLSVPGAPGAWHTLRAVKNAAPLLTVALSAEGSGPGRMTPHAGACTEITAHNPARNART